MKGFERMRGLGVNLCEPEEPRTGSGNALLKISVKNGYTKLKFACVCWGKHGALGWFGCLSADAGQYVYWALHHEGLPFLLSSIYIYMHISFK